MTDISFYNKGGLYVPLCQDDLILPIYIVVKCLLTVAKISHIVYHLPWPEITFVLDTPFYEYCVILHLEIIDAAILLDVCILVSA